MMIGDLTDLIYQADRQATLSGKGLTAQKQTDRSLYLKN